jgi:hypothetical protein
MSPRRPSRASFGLLGWLDAVAKAVGRVQPCRDVSQLPPHLVVAQPLDANWSSVQHLSTVHG